MELIYIGNHQSRFIRGNKYKVISITEAPYQKLRILDKDGVYQEFILRHWKFIVMRDWKV